MSAEHEPVYVLVNRTYEPCGFDIGSILTPAALAAVREARGRAPHTPLQITRHHQDAARAVLELREAATRTPWLLAPFRIHPAFLADARVVPAPDGREALRVDMGPVLEKALRGVLDYGEAGEAEDVLRAAQIQRAWTAEDEAAGWIESRLGLDDGTEDSPRKAEHSHRDAKAEHAA